MGTIPSTILGRFRPPHIPRQNSLNGPVKDCLGPSYTDRFKTKRRFITKNANIAEMQLYKETTGVSVFKPSADKL